VNLATRYVARACLILGVVWALLIPSLAFADDDESGSGSGRSCSGASASHSPQCSAPEVPMAAIYPALGGLSFAVVRIVRARRRDDDDEPSA
jgi:hypothetical protein